VDFTREPIIETVITPKEGYKLVVRSSKTSGLDEYFVDAVEVITFGNAIFLRSTERPKSFMVPASDYEVLEVREARMVLRNVGLDRSIKIAGGREPHKPQPLTQPKEFTPQADAADSSQQSSLAAGKKERRRHPRRRRGRDEVASADSNESAAESSEDRLPQAPSETGLSAEAQESLMSRLLAPPPLISETIAHYKEKFKDAFYTKEEQEANRPLTQVDTPKIALEQPEFGSFELNEDAEEEIYRQRKRHYADQEEASKNEIVPEPKD
jgi:hypothetical protein